MTLFSRLVLEADKRHEEALSNVLEEALDVLTPRGPLPRSAVSMLLRRAVRNGAWRLLSSGLRAFLFAAARAPIRVYRSPLLVGLIRRVWLLVELATVRGRAVVAALLSIVARGGSWLAALARRGLDSLLALGIQLLHDPFMRLYELVESFSRLVQGGVAAHAGQ